MIDSTPYMGIMVHSCGDYFVCTNPKCDVEKIFGDGDVILIKGGK